ncbi:sensor histidine kinase [Glaciecola sp. 2405UD65-10]|uniref:sensor histidine kinase n=1 Tax=Glaciecola sp. 2405UD65-10 TaxID=3397244 RepID=UPI003B59AB2E
MLASSGINRSSKTKKKLFQGQSFETANSVLPSPGKQKILHVVSDKQHNTHHQVSPSVSSQTSEQKHNEHHDHQRFSHLLSIMPAGVLVVDKTGLVSLANQQAIALLGEPLIGASWREVIARAFAPKADDGHEVSMRNGKRVKIDISPLTEEKGQLIVVTDLTETRQLQTRVGHMQRLSSLGKMVASLAHQVRTPLSSAMLYAENLKSMPLHNEMASRFTQKLSLRLQELESQVNDMLLFAKSSDKQIVSKVSSKEIAEQAISQVEAQLEQDGIILSLQNKACELNILGNTTAITGALTNLLMNAKQALMQSNQSEPSVQLHINPVKHNNIQYVVFNVFDNADGIDETKINRLFEPFYTSKSQGTGLGLAVVNTVAKSHKGFAKCGNNPRQGAYFSIYLPAYLEDSTTNLNQAQSGVYDEQN